jgi:hypothetical protein
VRGTAVQGGRGHGSALSPLVSPSTVSLRHVLSSPLHTPSFVPSAGALYIGKGGARVNLGVELLRRGLAFGVHPIIERVRRRERREEMRRSWGVSLFLEAVHAPAPNFVAGSGRCRTHRSRGGGEGCQARRVGDVSLFVYCSRRGGGARNASPGTSARPLPPPASQLR